MELSYFETLQMIQAVVDRMESVFQYWMSATFAAIVASHLSGEKLTRIYAGMLTGLYLVFTISVAVRLLTWSYGLERYSGLLREYRGDLSGSPLLGNIISGSAWATLILGTMATIVFIWHSYSSNKSKGAITTSHATIHLSEQDSL